LILSADGSTTGVVTDVVQSLPPAQIGRGLSVTVISGNGANHFTLIPIVFINTGTYAMNYGTGMPPIDVFSIDSKIDDGKPTTGIALAGDQNPPIRPTALSPARRIGSRTPSAWPTSIPNSCVIGTGAAITDTYNLIASTGGNDLSCTIAIKFQ
jgi:hypothetical protein